MVASIADALDEPVVDMVEPNDEPKHGAQDYRNGHRCSVCRAAIAKANAEYRKRRGLRPPRVTVDAGPARANTEALVARGMPVLAIARRAEVPKETLLRLLYSDPPTAALEEGKAARIESVSYDPAACLRGVLAIGAKRRLEALHWKGWAFKRLTSRIGLHRDAIKLIVNGTWHTISPELHRRIADFYAKSWLVDGGDLQAKKRARERRFVPPGGWDIDTIDDPSALPDPGVDWAA